MKKIKRQSLGFIYYGSSGIAGGYTARFIEGLAINENVHAFVNFNYVYKHDNPNIVIHHVFFPFTDHLITQKFFFRNAVRFIELAVGYAITLIFLFRFSCRLVIYSPITNFAITNFFASIAKRCTELFVVIVHEAQSHYDVSEGYRDSVFKNADMLIIHNEHSRIVLRERLGIGNSILLLPFPWSFLKFSVKKTTKLPNFLFIGHVRPSKGINLLLQAYSAYKLEGGTYGLFVAGSMQSTDYKKIKLIASKTINETLSDEKFLSLISASKFIVMPYRPGYFNSSVHFCAVIHCGVPFICSDIELFDEYEDGVDCLKFKHEDLNSFISVLKKADKFNEFSRAKMAANALKKMQVNMNNFNSIIGNFLK